MGRCASVRKKGATDQCSLNALVNSEFCGRHSKCLVHVRWEPPDTHVDIVIKLQSLVRRFLVKKRLLCAGPGVLTRSVCVNDEELVTLDDKQSVHPFDYFGWMDGDKVWWMSIPSILQLFAGELLPTNPYSRTPFPREARKRLRKIYVYRMRHNLPVSHAQSATGLNMLTIRMNTICQIMEENGYDGYHPETWYTMSTTQLLLYMQRLIQSMVAWSLEIPKKPWRTGLLNYVRKNYMNALHDRGYSRWYAVRATMTSLIQERNLEDIVFMVAASRYQVLNL